MEVEGREVGDLTHGLKDKEVKPHGSVASPSVKVSLADFERGFVAVAELQTGKVVRSPVTRPDPSRAAEVEEHNRQLGG